MENKSNKPLMIVLTVIICVVLLAVMLVVLLLGTDIPALRQTKQQVSQFLGLTAETKPAETEPLETEPLETLPVDLKSYTVDDETAKKNGANVVATVGAGELTNSDLQIYYQMAYANFLSQYGYYISYIGLDTTKPLDQQVCDPESNVTWQEFMMENGLQMWYQYSAVKQTAEAEGFTLDEEGQKYVAEIDDTIAKMLENTEYATVEEMLTKEMGASATVEAYRSYMLTAHYVISYVESLQEKLTPTVEQVEAYYMGKAETYTANGLVKDDGDFVDVRHVLIMPEGGTLDSATNTTVYTEEEWEACRQKAQALLDSWQSGEATEETFAQLARENSDDNAEEGGLYEEVTKNYMVESFNDWIFDESRVPGESGLVKTKFGYHLMYFVKRYQAEPKWVETVRQDYLSEMLEKAITDAVAQYELDVNYDAIGLSQPAAE